MLVLEIALGIVLGFVLLGFLPQIVAIISACAISAVGLVAILLGFALAAFLLWFTFSSLHIDIAYALPIAAGAMFLYAMWIIFARARKDRLQASSVRPQTPDTSSPY